MQEQKEYMQKVEKLLAFHCPRYHELPAIELYLDQVLRVVNDSLAVFCPSEEEKIITGTMVNNYVKQKVIPAPVRKQYDRDQLCKLIVICLLKQIFSITEISELFHVQALSYPFDVAYDYFCCEFENALRFAFVRDGQPMPSIETKKTPQTDLLRSMVLAISNKIYVQAAITQHLQMQH